MNELTLKKLDKNPKKNLIIVTSGESTGIGYWGVVAQFEKLESLSKRAEIVLIGPFEKVSAFEVVPTEEESGAVAFLKGVELAKREQGKRKVILITGPVYKVRFYRGLAQQLEGRELLKKVKMWLKVNGSASGVGDCEVIAGQTELLEAYFEKEGLMTFSWKKTFGEAKKRLYAALFTRHVALRKVPDLVMDFERWQAFFKVAAFSYLAGKRTVVLGLNPHASEGDAFGNEDLVLKDRLKSMAVQYGFEFLGIKAADTAFWFDAELYVSLYHDQWLPYLKGAHYSTLVEETAGLPVYRFSAPSGPACDRLKGRVWNEEEFEKFGIVNPYKAIFDRTLEVIER